MFERINGTRDFSGDLGFGIFLCIQKLNRQPELIQEAWVHISHHLLLWFWASHLTSQSLCQNFQNGFKHGYFIGGFGALLIYLKSMLVDMNLSFSVFICQVTGLDKTLLFFRPLKFWFYCSILPRCAPGNPGSLDYSVLLGIKGSFWFY